MNTPSITPTPTATPSDAALAAPISEAHAATPAAVAPAEGTDAAAAASPVAGETTASQPGAADAPEAITPDTTATAAPAAIPAATAAATPAAPAKPAGKPLPAPADTPRGLLKQFQDHFAAFRDCLPLSIGIDKQILAQMPDLNRKLMRTALGIHTGSLRYLRVMEKAKVRHDLDGKAGAEVTQTHRDHATQVLQQRFKKEADRKKAERDAAAAEREAAAAAEADRLRAEKLSQLTAKFSRKG